MDQKTTIRSLSTSMLPIIFLTYQFKKTVGSDQKHCCNLLIGLPTLKTKLKSQLGNFQESLINENIFNICTIAPDYKDLVYVDLANGCIQYAVSEDMQTWEKCNVVMQIPDEFIDVNEYSLHPLLRSDKVKIGNELLTASWGNISTNILENMVDSKDQINNNCFVVRTKMIQLESKNENKLKEKIHNTIQNITTTLRRVKEENIKNFKLKIELIIKIV